MRKNYIPISTKGMTENINKMSTSELFQLRRMLAKRLNSRALSLERKGYTKTGAYKDYENLLNKFYGGRKRIPENMKNDDYKGTLKTQIKAIRKVLEEKSSTVQGWNEINDKRRRTLKEKYGIVFKSNNEMAMFFEHEQYRFASKMYGSGQGIEVLANKLNVNNKSKQEIMDSLQEFRDKHDITKADDVAKMYGFDNDVETMRYLLNLRKSRER